MTEFGIRVNENGVMLRPTRSDEIVRRRAAELALIDVKRWQCDLGSDAEIIKSLMRSIDKPDGYEIVKSLEERDGWCGNSELVEIMDGDFIGQAERELVEQWVKCLGITLDVPIGTAVRIKDTRGVGVVTKHYPESAKYGVHTPKQSETSCWCVLPEEIEVIANGVLKCVKGL